MMASQQLMSKPSQKHFGWSRRSELAKASKSTRTRSWASRLSRTTEVHEIDLFDGR